MSDTPSPTRLVIRIKLPAERPPEAPVRPRFLSRGALLLILGAVAVVVLSWVGISMFRADPTSAPAATEGAPNSGAQSPAPAPAPSEAAPVVSDEPLPKPATETVPINEVIPNVSRSARETIRGTIVVSVRVIVGKEGTVLGTTVIVPGPSRYFERLAVEAAKKWTFTPADSAEQRTMLVSFYFRRAGITARAKSLQ